jgi:hypothetical protein
VAAALFSPAKNKRIMSLARITAESDAQRDEVSGEGRKLHNEQLHDLYSSPSVIRIMKSGK